MFSLALLPPRQSFLLGPSTVFCVAVVACTVVISPSTISKLSCTTCIRTGIRHQPSVTHGEVWFCSGKVLWWHFVPAACSDAQLTAVTL